MSDWSLTFKPGFLSELLKVETRDARLITQKLELLEEDPTPDAKVKKLLKHSSGALCRIRAGNYRIFYTYKEPFVSVLKLDRREKDTYDDMPEAEQLGGLDGDLPAESAPAPVWAGLLPATRLPARLLPETLTPELLTRLRVPPGYHAALATVADEDALLNCPGVPDDVLLRLDEALFDRGLLDRMAQPDLVAQQGADDLLRFHEGALEAFLLRLSPPQERAVSWAVDAKGPTLLKGGPGTGKSTVALYRARAVLQALRRAGVAAPRILFTTYTHALVNFSQHLLRSLLGQDFARVEVRTADAIVNEIVGGNPVYADNAALRRALAAARSGARFPGNALQQRAMTRTLEKLSDDYLIEEILGLIEARGIATLEAYQDATRPGRKVALNATQRQTVWIVREAFLERLRQEGRTTWTARRAEAARRVERGEAEIPPYDAVIIDEAQDLEPNLLRVLVGLCASPGRLFLTADANQSIYGGGFRWQDVHQSLRFQGRTAVLRANYRSTREIGEAAWSFLLAASDQRRRIDGLRDAVLDREDMEREYQHTGPQPAARAVRSDEDEVKLLVRFLPAATRAFHLGNHAAAVICPSNESGQAIAAQLTAQGLDAVFMTSRDMDLGRKVIKVMPLRAAKGLEFPVVALAGFRDRAWPPRRPQDEEQEERLAQERRAVFVAMTRAMRALLVIVPEGEHPVLHGFDPRLWNLEER